MNFDIHYDNDIDRYVLIYSEGSKRGLRANWNDEEWRKWPIGIEPEKCGVDKEFVFPDRPHGQDCDYSVRFFSFEGAEFFLRSAETYQSMMETYRAIMFKEMPVSLHKYQNAE